MNIRTIFFTFLILFFSYSAEAGDTIYGTSTRLIDASNINFFLEGTETTIEMPYIVRVDITPQDVVCSAGDSIKFVAEAMYNTGKVVSIVDGFTCVGGSIKDGIFTSLLAGKAVVSNDYNGVRGNTEITVLPSKPTRLTVDMPDRFDYGETYDFSGIASYALYDSYGNQIKIEQSPVLTFLKNQPCLLATQLSGGTPNPIARMIAPVLRAGYVIEKDKILFFERGSYTVTGKYNDIIATKVIDVTFVTPFQDIIAWLDYRVTLIDFDTGLFRVSYAIDNEPVVSTIAIPKIWLDMFYEGSMMDRMKVLCWGHYAILGERSNRMTENRHKQLQLLLKSILKGDIIQ